MYRFIFFILLLTVMVGCTSQVSEETQPMTIPEFDPPAKKLGNGEMSHIVVQHILIGFKGSKRGVVRSFNDAKTLATEVLEKAQSGEDFDKLVTKYTDDEVPGIYRMANFGESNSMTSPNMMEKIFPREKMVPAFGGVGFPLEVGEVGMAEFDDMLSPFGWHVIKRLK